MKKYPHIVYQTSEAYKHRIDLNKIALWLIFVLSSSVIVVLTKSYMASKIDSLTAYGTIFFSLFVFTWFGFKIIEFTLELIREYDLLKYEELQKDK
jgi:hypothetical protein